MVSFKVYSSYADGISHPGVLSTSQISFCEVENLRPKGRKSDKGHEAKAFVVSFGLWYA